MAAFKHGFLKPADPAMLDPKRFTTQTLHVAMGLWRGPHTTLAAFLASPAVQAKGGANTSEVALAVFQPSAAVPASAAAPAEPAAPWERVEGATCPTCGEAVRWRQPLTSSYLGCRCG